MRRGALLSLLVWPHVIAAQQGVGDTTRAVLLNPVRVEGVRPDIHPLPATQGTYLFSGRKSEVIVVSEQGAALAEKQGRQLLAKVPGLFVYDMDGTGNQLNIATRGLDPHRGWEFNIRKDGVITNTDMYGYPASHFSLPMEVVERIELVRGTGSLEYGAQFGGMLNYITKGPDSTRVFAFESVNTVGSFNLLSTFNRASGTWRKWSYNAWMQRRGSDGYRRNSRSDFQAQHLSIGFRPSDRIDLTAGWARSDYLVQLAGPLTDAMFQADPRSATRSRNYYEPDIHVPWFTVRWLPFRGGELQWTTSAVLGTRTSVLFDRPATVVDRIDSTTLQYAPRQVDIDDYRSTTSELRLRHHYRTGRTTSTWVAGVQGIRNDMRRRQQGQGTTGTDHDLQLVVPGWGRDLHYRTRNLALFAENRWCMTARSSLTVGMRYEWGRSDLEGTTSYPLQNELPHRIAHRYPLLGAALEHGVGAWMTVHAGWAQAYRPVLMKDVVPASPFERTDPDLRDSRGHNAEIGIRGRWKAIRWDVSAYQLFYGDRVGALVEQDSAGNALVRRTNIGSSVSRGVECFIQADVRLGPALWLTLFTSTAYLDARYKDAVVRQGGANVDISGNRVESAPEWTSRNGLTLRYKALRLNALYSWVSETFADPMNTVEPNASGTVGLVPSYGLLDVGLTLPVQPWLELRAHLNNALDARYFTKRPQFYPGPGVWPSDGRNWSVSVAVRL